MNCRIRFVLFIISIPLISGAVVVSASQQSSSLVLFDFHQDFNIDSVTTSDAKVTLSESRALRIQTGHTNQWPGITLKAPAGKWDLSKYQHISIDVINVGIEKIKVNCRVDNPGADGRKNCVTDNITLNAGATGTLIVQISPSPGRLSEPVELIGMRGAPTHSSKVDPANITQLLVYVTKSDIDYKFEIKNIRAGGRSEMLDVKTFFPFIDVFGQYIHKDWPGKTHSLEKLIEYYKVEQKDLNAYPGPTDRNKYGGWTAGPELKATGFFRAEKYNGKWWLVDPEGRLFWSHGIDCVRENNDTPISDREHYWKWLPDDGSPFARFYGRGSWAPHGYYKDHTPYRTYDFSRSNFRRKYGRAWQVRFAAVTHQRLRSWGLNTIANWSQPSIYLWRRTPYVCTISYDSKRLEGSEGYWGKFYDVFDPSFRQALRGRLALEKGRAINDPWCIGYFVHNEIAWGDDVSLAVAALVSPADQPAKKVFVTDLKAKYRTINKLNSVWGTKHASWQALMQSQEAPDKKKAQTDLTTFYTNTAETYFETIRDELKKVAPNQLYMGCRFAWVNDLAAKAAVKSCDIVSYNRYSYSVAEHRLPDSIDMPMIIGEFHFGALDRGMFHTGLKKTTDQQDRAAKYKSYVQGALRNPYIVGTHWFQYKDQATTGRGDGENYQIGFIDICDKPYPEIVKASREVGYELYEYRLQNR
ncbi:MAG: beta-agarase [Planctomycetes bacterium]|nr:beta-agarase [Planctomycetota bacterium]